MVMMMKMVIVVMKMVVENALSHHPPSILTYHVHDEYIYLNII